MTLDGSLDLSNFVSRVISSTRAWKYFIPRPDFFPALQEFRRNADQTNKGDLQEFALIGVNALAAEMGRLKGSPDVGTTVAKLCGGMVW